MNDTSITRLNELKNQLLTLPEATHPKSVWADLDAWIAKATPVIRNDWPEFLDDFGRAIVKPDHSRVVQVRSFDDSEFNQQQMRAEWERDKQDSKNVANNIVSFLDGLLTLTPTTKARTGLDTINLVCRRFPIFVRQLKTRQRERPPFEITDEYDVQYLLLALLRLHFNDVRTEVWTPSYAGGSSRMDFLIKQEKIVVEAKKTKETLHRDNQIADQLIIDIERYGQSPDCEKLVCFIYDPDNWIDNPAGLEADLSGFREDVEVIVIVSPN